MERGVARRLRGIAALMTIVAIAAGVPLLLARIAHWPLPRSVPDWARVRTALMQGDIPADTVVRALAVIVWLIWLQVMWALVWEIAVNVPRMTAGRRPTAAPLVAGPVGNGVGRLVALVLSIGLTVASMPSTAIALPSAPIPNASLPAPAVVRAVSESPPASVVHVSGVPQWKVAEHDSLWRIAEVALGEGDRSSEILELNRWVGSPLELRAGQVLVLPADASVPADRQAQAPPTPAAEVGPITYVAPTHIVIEPGDTLWDLAENRLSIVDADITPHETFDHVNEVIALNPDVVEDPNLIYPGEVFAFPAVGDPPTPEPPAETPTPATPATDTTAEVDAPEVVDVRPSTTPTILPAPAIDTPRPAQTTPAPTSQTADPAPVTPDVRPANDHVSEGVGSRPVAPWVAGISGATVLASGLLLMYRQRLTLRAVRGARAYRAATPDDPTMLTALTRAADVSLLFWANHEMAKLFSRMSPGDVGGMPLAVELSRSHGIELLWTEANAHAPDPWEMIDGGWSWHLPYDEDLPLPVGEQATVLPALVTVGTRDGNQLLLNLEALGSVAIDAPDESAQAFARSIIVELAAGELLSDAYVAVSGITVDGAPHFDRVQRCGDADATQRLAAALSAGSQFLEASGLHSMFDVRLGGDAAGREATIVAVSSGGVDATTIRDVGAGLGVSAVVVGRCERAAASVTIDNDGHAVLEPLGLRFEPALLPVKTMEAVEDLLDEASEPFVNVEHEVPNDVQPTDVAQSVEEDEPTPDLGDDDPWELPEPKVLVRVFGAPEIVGYPQLGRIETSIVAYLACYGGQRTADQIVNAVWNGRLVESKTLWNKISKIRAALGPDLVPPRQPHSVKVRLADDVMSDLGVLRSLFDRSAEVSSAEAVELLLRGLELVAGVPFDSPDYEWVFESQHHAEASELVESAALRCSRTALELGDTGSARLAIVAGLRALPGNEPLYRERMRVESSAGNPDGVCRSLDDLRSTLAEEGDWTRPTKPEFASVQPATQHAAK